jgi:hypothetical protein
MKSKTGPSVTSALQSVLNYSKYSKPIRRRSVWVQTEREKEFLNRPLQDMLKREGSQFHLRRIPDVKCAVVEPVRHVNRNKLYGYFSYKDT